jgi:hypothetical protein
MKKTGWKVVLACVAEPHHFYAVLGENFNAAPAPTLLLSMPPFWNKQKLVLGLLFSLIFYN